MRRELLVLRHAKSAWNTAAASDFDRPLSGRGRRDAPRVGRFLADAGLAPDYVVASPARRARQTVIAVCAELGVDEQAIAWDERIYHAGTGTLMDVLAASPPGARRVLIAGHNPGLEMLVQTLCRELVPMPADWKLMPTAAVAHLAIPGDWRDLDGGTAELLGLTRPRDLAD
jgi:phosphohistidine phosphatase